MPGSINNGQQPLAVHGEDNIHQQQEYITTTNNEHYNDVYANDGLEEYSEKPAAPVNRPFYKKKKYWIICSIVTIIVAVVAILLILFVAFPKIAQSTMNHSQIEVNLMVATT